MSTLQYCRYHDTWAIVMMLWKVIKDYYVVVVKLERFILWCHLGNSDDVVESDKGLYYVVVVKLERCDGIIPWVLGSWMPRVEEVWYEVWAPRRAGLWCQLPWRWSARTPFGCLAVHDHWAFDLHLRVWICMCVWLTVCGLGCQLRMCVCVCVCVCVYEGLWCQLLSTWLVRSPCGVLAAW